MSKKSIPVRFVLLGQPDPNTPAEIAVIQGKDSTHYLVASLPHDFGAGAFRFRKCRGDMGTDPDETTYDVIVAAGESACSCKGFQRHGLRQCPDCGGYGYTDEDGYCDRCGGDGSLSCKHLKAALWLIEEGLDLPRWRDWPNELIKVRIVE
jgi:hypothetical protein